MSDAVEINSGGVPAMLAEVQKQASPRRWAVALATAGRRVVQNHLLALPHNKKGWPVRNFWKQCARSVTGTPLHDGAVISINYVGFRQRLQGGTIRPVKAKALTIPISPVSYGHRASDFPGLFLLKTKHGPFLAQKTGGPGKETKADKSRRLRQLGGNTQSRRDVELEYLFKLSGGVDQDPNPNALPDDATFDRLLVDTTAKAFPA